MDEEYDSFSFDETDDMDDDDLLFAELEAYAAVQRTSTMRPLPCDCTEFVSAEMYVRCLKLVIPRHYLTVMERRRRRVQPDSSAASETVNTSNQGDTLAAKSPLKRRARNAIRMAAANRLSRQVANRVIKFARAVKNIYENEMSCFNCGLLPICPVTGECGHTRCYKCAVGTKCTCGTFFSHDTSVNILIQNLTKKYTSALPEFRNVPRLTKLAADAIPSKENASSSQLLPRASCSSARLKRLDQAGPSRVRKQGVPMAPLARYNHAVDLLRMGHHRDAIPHLALAAAAQPSDRQARTLLAQAITTLSRNSDPRGLTTQLNRAVRRLSTTLWVKAKDLECILCCDNFTEPVTTPCGHTFCRTCVERMLDYAKRCPLCLRDLQAFKLSETKNTLFVQAALRLANAVSVSPPLEPDIIPIFVCTVAYPSLPCPLYLFEPRYWLMIRRILESGSRRFGMIAFESSQDYANYGTILEVRDCVILEDGRTILSTIGISRFQVLEFANRDGCDVARIAPITDKEPTDLDEIKEMATNILCKTLPWLDLLNEEVYADIIATFGVLQTMGFYDDPWWEGPDGPTWLWWIVAVLPLRKEIKVLILSTDSLVKRMMAVERTLDAMERTIDSLINPSPRTRYSL